MQLCPVLTLTLQGNEKGAGGPTFPLEPNVPYEWAFQCTLPSGELPGTLYFKEGTHITYNLTGFVDVPTWRDPEIKYDLNVGGAPLASLPPTMSQPVDIHQVMGVHACWYMIRRGDAVLHLALPKGAVEPFVDGKLLDGRNMPIWAGVDNVASSRVSVEKAEDCRRLDVDWVAPDHPTDAIEASPQSILCCSPHPQSLQTVSVQLVREVWLSNGWTTDTTSSTIMQLNLADKLEAGQSLDIRHVNLNVKVSRG